MAKILYSPSVVDNPDVQTPRQLPDDYQRIQTDTGQFGGLIGSAEQQAGSRLEQGSNELADAAFKIQNVKNTTDANSATQQYVDNVNKVFYGDGTDANKGLFNLKGKEALDALPAAMAQMKQVFTDGGNSLTNPVAKNLYDAETRRYYMAHEDQVFRFGQSAQKEYAENQNDSTIASAHTSSALNYNNDTIADADIDRATNGLVQKYQLKFGNPTDDTRASLRQEAISQNMQNRVNGAVARGDYATAHSILGKYGPQGDPLKYRELNDMVTREEYEQKHRGQADYGKSLGDSIFNGTPIPPGPGGSAAPSAIHAAIYGTEGSGPEAVSVQGATGRAQILESTFNDNKQAGESFSNEKDREAVANRLIDNYTQQYNGDASRVAVAYFSGPGNVAPPGNPTPWISDKHDGNGNSTSNYVKSVLGRLGGSGSSTPPSERGSASTQPAEADQGNTVATILSQGGKAYELTNAQADKYYGIKDFGAQQKFLETLEPRTENAPAGAGEAGPPTAAPDTVQGQPQPQAKTPALAALPDLEDLLKKIPNNLSPEAYNAANSRVTQLYNQHIARIHEEQRKMVPWLQGGISMLADGKDFQYDPATVRHYLPRVDADKYLDALDTAAQVGQWKTKIETMNPQQIQDVSNTLHHNLDTALPDQFTRADTIIKHFDSAVKSQTVQMMGGVNEQGQTVHADPVGYLRRVDPILDQQRQAVDFSNPASVDSYANAIGARQDQMGVPPSLQHVVSRTEAQGIANQISADPAKAAQQMESLKQQWGTHWHDVFADAVTMGKLPAPYQMVEHLEDNNDPHNAALLARGIAGSAKEEKEYWKNTIGDKAKNKIDEGILGNQTYQNFIASMQHSNFPVDQMNGLINSIHTLAYAKTAYEGNAIVSDAATDAVNALIGNHYDFLSEYGGARVPSNVSNTVRQNIDFLRNSLTVNDVTIPPLKDGVTPDQYVAMLKARPSFVTSKRDDTVFLVDKDGLQVKDINGRQVEVPFNAPLWGKTEMVAPPYMGP